MITLAHFTNEPHIALSAALLVFALGVSVGVCVGLFFSRRAEKKERR